MRDDVTMSLYPQWLLHIFQGCFIGARKIVWLHRARQWRCRAMWKFLKDWATKMDVMDNRVLRLGWLPGQWWRHQMEAFTALLALCAGIHRSPVNSPHKDHWRGALMFSLICAWINDREAGDLGRHRAYYDVIVMSSWRTWMKASSAVGPFSESQSGLYMTSSNMAWVSSSRP